jgi:hypothetical protein
LATPISIVGGQSGRSVVRQSRWSWPMGVAALRRLARLRD